MVLIGTSGWQYSDWRGVLYPNELPTRDWLAYYSQEFPCVEVNMTYYRMPEARIVARWAAATAEEFRFCIKLNRTVTHLARLRDASVRIPRFLEALAPLKEKLGAVLVQLPPTFGFDYDRLAGALAAFPPEVRVAVEFRHDSWWRDETRTLLDSHGAALCHADRAEMLTTPSWVTASWSYARLHEGSSENAPCYTKARLLDWVRRLRAKEQPPEGFLFFNNDSRGCAVRDARRLRKVLEG